MKPTFLTLITFFILSACSPKQESGNGSAETINFEAISLLGDTLISPPPSQKAIDNYLERKANFEAVPSADNWVWYARFIAYQGKYKEAIAEYTKAIEQFPNDARFYRHRGHRYISIREFDKAIADLEKAAELRQGLANEIEPDGTPNAQNIPVSTLHGNIYYHLGLAHYLKGDMEPALEAYQKAIEASQMDDNIVSGVHWVYMILRRMGKEEEARKALDVINKDIKIIENFAYYDLCLFYKGVITLEQVTKSGEGELSNNDAVNYGIGNWYLYNENEPKAGEIFESIIANPGWAPFGYIAAEADLLRLSNQ
jgi:tetratricopeptide (TPR) repeat protein